MYESVKQQPIPTLLLNLQAFTAELFLTPCFYHIQEKLD